MSWYALADEWRIVFKSRPNWNVLWIYVNGKWLFRTYNLKLIMPRNIRNIAESQQITNVHENKESYGII